MTLLNDEFLGELATLAAPYPRYKWYLSALVALGAMNYPEEIPALYERLLASYIPKDEQFLETRKIREAFTKLCGIQGAAKTGSALRQLYKATPKELLDPVIYRKEDTDEVAFARGEAFHKRIYAQNPTYDDNANNLAAPDYHFLVRNYFYGRIFSFDKILDDLETSQCIVSCLVGIDCMQQLGNQMKGMQYNGARKEEVNMIREIVIRVAKKLDVRFKPGNPIPVPDIE